MKRKVGKLHALKLTLHSGAYGFEQLVRKQVVRVRDVSDEQAGNEAKKVGEVVNPRQQAQYEEDQNDQQVFDEREHLRGGSVYG